MVETQTMAGAVGSQQRAEQIAAWHHCDIGDLDGFEPLASGDHRTVYVDHDTDTVYKIGVDRVNRFEVETLANLRAEGAQHAPEATLWTVQVYDPRGGDLVECTLVAMPYLPEDGSVEHEGVILPGAGDLNPANIHANGGKLWLIDAGGLW